MWTPILAATSSMDIFSGASIFVMALRIVVSKNHAPVLEKNQYVGIEKISLSTYQGSIPDVQRNDLSHIFSFLPEDANHVYKIFQKCTSRDLRDRYAQPRRSSIHPSYREPSSPSGHRARLALEGG